MRPPRCPGQRPERCGTQRAAHVTIAPAEALPVLEARIAREDDFGRALLQRLVSLTERYSACIVRLEDWGAAMLERLYSVLHEAFPPDRERDAPHGLVTTEDRLRELRGDIPVLLSRRGREGDSGALRRLAAKTEWIRRWLAREGTLAAGKTVLRGGPCLHLPRVPSGEPAWIPVAEAVDLLDDPERRVLRAGADLLRVTMGVLDTIGEDSRHYLTLLYGTPRRGTHEREHLHEEALRDFLCMRLKGLLPRRVGDGQCTVVVTREELSTRLQRTDLLVRARTVSGDLAEVVIEVKWSDNPALSSALRDQLAARYLVEAGRRHGIYVVGWANRQKWLDQATNGPRPRPVTIPVWTEALQEQARKAQEHHQGIEIGVRVLDLRWPAGGEAATAGAGPGRQPDRRRPG